MTLEELEKRIRVLEDIEEIKQLHRKYTYALGSQQWDDMLDCFTEDATADIWRWGLRKGKAEIADLFKNVFNGRIQPTHGHLVSQPVISVDGDRAKGYWLLYLHFAEPSVSWIQGRHDCEYVRVDGKWKISSLKFTRPWPVVPEKPA